MQEDTGPDNEILVGATGETDDFPSIEKGKQLHIPKAYLGVILVLLSAFAFSIMTYLVEETGKRGIPSFQMMAIRCFIQIWYSGFLCLWEDVNPFGTPGNRALPFLSGLIGPLVGVCLFYGATHISIADSTVLLFSSPIWTPFIARVFLKESIRLMNLIAVFLGFIGVVFVAQPGFIFGYSGNSDEGLAEPGSLEYSISALICVFGAVCAAFVYTIIRKSGGAVHFHVLVFYYGLVGTFTSSVLLLLFQGLPVIPQDGITISLLLFISLCGCIGQTTMNKGGQMIDASKTSILRNADIGFVLLWQVLLLHQLPTIYSIIGLVLICVCTILGALAKSSEPNQEEEEEIEIQMEEIE